MPQQKFTQWPKALRYFIMDRILTIFNCFIFIIAECPSTAAVVLGLEFLNLAKTR